MRRGLDRALEDNRMSYRLRLRLLMYFCSLCVVLLIPVLVYLSSPTVTSEVDYSNNRISESRLHVHRTGDSADCEILDVVVMINDQKSCNNAVLLIKSVLLFRRSPIRLHLLVDLTARHVMETLLRTWHIYELEYHFYNTADKVPGWGQRNRVNPIILVDILPPSVEKIIYSEPEVLFSVDVHHLWNVFSDMKRQKCVLGAVHTHGGEGFRNEVLLLNIKRLREILKTVPFRDSWRQTNISRTLSSLYSFDKTLFFPLNPGWSVYNSDIVSTRLNQPCYHQQSVCAHSSIGSSHLKNLIQEYDGNLLRDRWINCQTGPSFDKNAIDYRERVTVYDPPCTDFKREGNQVRRTHPFYAGQWLVPHKSHQSSSGDITLVLHVTLDRLIGMLEPTCRHWEGPMSIAVFANDSEVSSLLNLIGSSPVISSRQNIAYHIVYKEGLNMYYPINPLRIAAIQNTATGYVFMNDMDFLPSFGLYTYLKDTVGRLDLNHTVLVVPAFETFEHPNEFVFPRDKSALVKLVSQNRVFQFHRDKYIRGHAPTDYPKWKKTNQLYEIQWQPQYEPYLVASRNITPLDPRFVSRHFNKVSHTEELYYQHYKFYVVPSEFILHLPHELSSDAKSQRTNERHSECYIRRRDEWRAEMVEQYGYEPYLVNVYKMWNRLSSSYETSL